MQWAPVFDQIAAELRKLVPSSVPTRSVVIETAPGDLIDKITILEIKSQRIGDEGKLRNVRKELETLCAARDRTVLPSDALGPLPEELRSVNEALWDIEDKIRGCERAGTLGRGSSSWRGLSTRTMIVARPSSGRSMSCWGADC